MKKIKQLYWFIYETIVDNYIIKRFTMLLDDKGGYTRCIRSYDDKLRFRIYHGDDDWLCYVQYGCDPTLVFRLSIKRYIFRGDHKTTKFELWSTDDQKFSQTFTSIEEVVDYVHANRENGLFNG